MTDAALRQRIIDECLQACLHDTKDAWLLRPDGSYVPASANGGNGNGGGPGGKALQGRVKLLSAQSSLMALYGSKG